MCLLWKALGPEDGTPIAGALGADSDMNKSPSAHRAKPLFPRAGKKHEERNALSCRLYETYRCRSRRTCKVGAQDEKVGKKSEQE
jgi:hypothetical protein